MLSYPQFQALSQKAQDTTLTQRAISERTGLSVGTINAALKELQASALLDRNNAITPAGMKALMPYKVDNAIIMAAGGFSQFAPIAYEKPKGMLKVRGEVLIERQIRQLKEAGIDDIVVVVGYMKELFFYLEDAFGVQIVVNSDYAHFNNNSSILCVERYLGNSYICSSDNYFTENPFEPYVYESYYAATYAEGPTQEYCLVTKGKRNHITEVTIGGSDAWYMIGHVYWDRVFSARFLSILHDIADNPFAFDKLWEDIYIEHIDSLSMTMRKYPAGVIWEFDSLDELRQFDPTFIDNLDSRILDNICSVLKCSRREIRDFAPMKQGLTNLSCRFVVDGTAYVYRHPGVETDDIVNRQSEAFSEQVAHDLGLDETFIYEDPEEGWKISLFIEDVQPFEYHNSQHVAQAMALLRTLHGSGVNSGFPFSIYEKARLIVDKLDHLQRTSFQDFAALSAKVEKANDIACRTDARQCLCHNDFYSQNLLVKDDTMQLIDWEYAGMSDYASDLATFICCCEDYSYEDALTVFAAYFQREPTETELLHCVASVAVNSFYWFVWALYKDACGEPVGEWVYRWYKRAKEYANIAFELETVSS